MHVTLLVPDLFWPHDDAAAACRDLDAPALTRLLSRAGRRAFSPLSAEAWLCQAFEVERQQDWPIAPVTLAWDGGDAGEDYWLRADPVHLAPRRDRLVLVGSETVNPAAADAEELVALMNLHFAPENLHFVAPHPSRWYVRVPGTPRLATREPSQAAGRDIAGALPVGEDSLRWRRALNEIQMLLHEHPVNQRREARGELPVNSVWLWGGGRRPVVTGQHFSHVAGTNALALALATRAGAATTAPAGVPGNRPAPADRAARLLVVADIPAARYGDVEGWRAALEGLEREWFEPLLAGLGRRDIDGVAVVALHPRSCERFEAAPLDRLRFWQPVRPLDALAPRLP